VITADNFDPDIAVKHPDSGSVASVPYHNQYSLDSETTLVGVLRPPHRREALPREANVVGVDLDAELALAQAQRQRAGLLSAALEAPADGLVFQDSTSVSRSPFGAPR
jgi:hypothetical protein